jgi:hypothetical protein
MPAHLPRTLAAAVVPLLLALPAAAATSRLAAHAGSARVYQESAGWRLEVAGGSRQLDLPAGAEISAVARLGKGWVVAGTRPLDNRRELVVVVDLGAGPVRLEPPAGAAAEIRDRPVPLVANGALTGLAWLEGASRETLAVRWAPWRGDGFGAPVEVAPPGPGSQLALAGAELGDGRALLVWAGFDGADDEIWAALGGPSGWSEPRRVGSDNDVPDITPDVVATPGGALVAWSRYDGSEYRVVVARFDGKAFAEIGQGPPGSLYPTFESPGSGRADGAGALLLWRDARTDAWSLDELDGSGGLVERARAEGPVEIRPAVGVGEGHAAFVYGSDRTVEAPLR